MELQHVLRVEDCINLRLSSQSVYRYIAYDRSQGGTLSTYVKVIVYFVPTFFSISASEFLKFSKFKYAENGIH